MCGRGAGTVDHARESVTARFTLRGWAHLLLVASGLFTALAIGEPTPALLTLPSGLILAFALSVGMSAHPTLEVIAAPSDATEGVPIEVVLEIVGQGRRAIIELQLPSGVELRSLEGAARIGDRGLLLSSGDRRVRLELVARRWGTYEIGSATIYSEGPFEILEIVRVVPAVRTLVVMPEITEVERLVEPVRTNLHAGDIQSRTRGAGVELAELRPWTAADPVRTINWRASARSEALWVTDRQAERNGDLVLVLDSLVSAGAEIESAVDAGVRITAGLIDAYGRTRHRLGLVTLTGVTRWFGLEGGRFHRHRLLQVILATQAKAEPVWGAVDRVFKRALRPPSLVAFVSPLLDDRLVGRIHTVARSGMDVVTVAVGVERWLGRPRDPVQELARRVWRLERRATVERLRAAGVAVARWERDGDLGAVLEELERWRRRTRRARI